jgi:thiol-disulfide isomerase/thioredoxin
MSLFSRNFCLGLASGIVLTLVLIPLAGYIAFQLFLKPSAPEILEARLRPPDLPGSYGQIDYDWSVRTLDGEKIVLSQFKGKPIFLNFWATWCRPCVAEMPSIQNLYDSLEGSGVAFIMVSQEEEETLREFVQTTGYTFPVYRSDKYLPEVFHARGVPITFISDNTGGIVAKHYGSAQWDHDSCVTFIRDLTNSVPAS